MAGKARTSGSGARCRPTRRSNAAASSASVATITARLCTARSWSANACTPFEIPGSEDDRVRLRLDRGDDGCEVCELWIDRHPCGPRRPRRAGARSRRPAVAIGTPVVRDDDLRHPELLEQAGDRRRLHAVVRDHAEERRQQPARQRRPPRRRGHEGEAAARERRSRGDDLVALGGADDEDVRVGDEPGRMRRRAGRREPRIALDERDAQHAPRCAAARRSARSRAARARPAPPDPSTAGGRRSADRRTDGTRRLVGARRPGSHDDRHGREGEQATEGRQVLLLRLVDALGRAPRRMEDAHHAHRPFTAVLERVGRAREVDARAAAHGTLVPSSQCTAPSPSTMNATSSYAWLCTRHGPAG